MNWKMKPYIWLGLLSIYNPQNNNDDSDPTWEENPIGITKQGESIYFKVFIASISMIFTLLWLSLSIYWDIRDYPRESINWFPRAGALLIFFSLWLEYELQHMTTSNRYTMWNGENILWGRYKIEPRLIKLYDFLLLSCVVLSLLGTLIWAYGDLILQWSI